MRLLTLNILLSVSLLINAQIYSTAHLSNQYNSGFQSTSYYNRPVIREYNSNNIYDRYNSYNEMNYNNYQKFGYSTPGGIREFNYSDIYNSGSDNMYFENQNSHKMGPRRAPRDHASGSETVTVDGCTATISWDVDANLLGWRWWTITYSDGTSETYWGTMNQAKAHAKQVAEDKARAQAEKMAQNPGDPYADPIGEFPIGLLLILSFGYLYYRKYKNDKLMLQNHNK